MFQILKTPAANESLTACGVPFEVCRTEGIVRKIEGNALDVNGCFRTLYFLGMSTESWQCSEWWAQTEVQYDASIRLFFGDRVGRIRILFDDRTEELISVIFGVNAFNYNLFFKGKPHEGNLMSFNAPYDEPFRSDPHARELLQNALAMQENNEDNAEKATKWVFGYRPRPDKRIVRIEWFKEEGKRADFLISGLTGVPSDSEDTSGLRTVDLDFFLKKAWYKPTEALKRRVYQYIDEIPDSVELLDIPGFDAPDIRFYNAHGLDLYTNVYRRNIMDMAYHKVSDDGMTHTSSAGTANFGCYIGFGTFNYSDAYGSHVWTRDIGRTLIEITDAGYIDRAARAVDRLHEMLYYPSVRFKIPHWKRVANLIAQNEQDLFNEGNENDGHASIMMAVYNLYRKGQLGRPWLEKNLAHLKVAADYYLWQESHPKESNFDGILYSHSETSSQTYGGYDLYANSISALAVRLYARLFDEWGDHAYADTLRGFADRLRQHLTEKFLCEHPTKGMVWTDTTDDCWTYEYKRFADIILAGDCLSLDMATEDPVLFDRLTRTFEAEKDVYYHPYSGRQMGYGQGYLTNASLLLDRVEEYTDCVNASAHLCYHHTDVPYIVPEGIILHGSGRYFFRNSDLGNAVQQAEIIKEARLMLGVDDLSPEKPLSLIPRMPTTMTAMEVTDYPVTTADGRKHLSYRFERSDRLPLYAGDGKQVYSLSLDGDVRPAFVRFGPFDCPDITSNGTILRKETINGHTYAYIDTHHA